MMRRWIRGLLILVALALVVACDREESVEDDTEQGYVVVATTTMLEDLVRHIGGDDVVVKGLVAVGGDPHVYQPRPADARTVASSDAVVMNGLLLEGWMENLVRHAGGERSVIVAGEAIDDGDLLRVEGAIDPHIWFDVQLWRAASAHVAHQLAQVFADDREVAARIRERHAHYDQILEQLHQWVGDQIATIDQERRVLITSHDAFNYFGRAYGIDVEAVQGLSTEQEASQRDVANIIELVQQRQAPAVFTETSVNSGLIDQVARETGVTRAGPLFSDSVGPAGSGAESYVGMVTANTRMIVEALEGDYAAFEALAGEVEATRSDEEDV